MAHGGKLGTRCQDETEAPWAHWSMSRLSSSTVEGSTQQVFHDEQDRLLPRFRVQPGQEGLQRFRRCRCGVRVRGG